MRRPLAVLLAVSLAAGCASDRAPGPSKGVAAEAPDEHPSPIGPAPAALIGLAVGAGLFLLLLANSGLSPQPAPPG